LIKDIKSVTLDDKASEKPTHFTIEFKTKDSKPVTYEAPNHAVARMFVFSQSFVICFLLHSFMNSGEIVGKLQYLLHMETKGGSNN
jgi:hypothetical protein